ncbi:ferredoxin [Sphingomonas koreensis]|nr:ferredoxin [Sphingomonas koreensis]
MRITRSSRLVRSRRSHSERLRDIVTNHSQARPRPDTADPHLHAAEQHLRGVASLAAPALEEPGGVPVLIDVNGFKTDLRLDSSVTLLDALRERLDLTGTKKGCDHGQCGACTVIVDGRRVLSCLTLLASCDGCQVQTVEALSVDGRLHPLQDAFIRHDAFQCGFCTPGQLCSMVALLDEARSGDVSYVTPDVRHPVGPLLSDAEIKERLSGNICRCGAYLHLIDAFREIQASTQAGQAAASLQAS